MTVSHNNNDRRSISLHERVARGEARIEAIREDIILMKKELDIARMQIANWVGRFAIISVVTGVLTGLAVSIIMWLIVK